MSGRYRWVRQYAHTKQNMGRAHIAQEGAAFTACGLPLRSTATWGHEYRPGSGVQGWCYTCAHRATQAIERARIEGRG